MKVALVHDHLAQDGGAERVLAIFHKIFPQAPIFVLVYAKERASEVFQKAQINTSLIQKMPWGLKRYQWYLPLMPLATERYNLFDYDLVLSSSSAFAKGIITRPETLHICYCHTPTRFLWSDTHSYTRELKYNKLVKKFIPFSLHKIRIWDRMAADRVDWFIANSKNIAQKIRKYYRRQSEVIYPPVETKKFRINRQVGSYFLTGGRLVAYKRFDLTIKAFNKLGWPLKIFGTGPEEKNLRRLGQPNVEFLGKVPEQELTDLYASSKAFIFAQEEDFGITALESMASGRPVIAYAKGGALETVIEGKTGIFFYKQTEEDLMEKVRAYKDRDFNPDEIRNHALKFDTEIFEQRLRDFIKGRNLSRKTNTPPRKFKKRPASTKTQEGKATPLDI